MPDLVAGTLIRAADYPPAESETDGTNLTNLTNTAYETGSPVVSVTFTAPTSGRVLVVIGVQANPAGTDRVYAAPEVYRGTSEDGDQVLPPDATTRGIICPAEATSSVALSRITLFEGLEAEAEYFAQHMHHTQTGAGVADIFARSLAIVPVP